MDRCKCKYHTFYWFVLSLRNASFLECCILLSAKHGERHCKGFFMKTFKIASMALTYFTEVFSTQDENVFLIFSLI